MIPPLARLTPLPPDDPPLLLGLAVRLAVHGVHRPRRPLTVDGHLVVEARAADGGRAGAAAPPRGHADQVPLAGRLAHQRGAGVFLALREQRNQSREVPY